MKNHTNLSKYISSKASDPFFIAEAGINHNGDIEIAKQMVLEAKRFGAHAIKFQTFKGSEICLDDSQRYTYQSRGKEKVTSMKKMFEQHELTEDNWRELKDYAEHVGIEFLSTPQNLTDLELLHRLGMSAIKVGSDDLINLPLIRDYSKYNLPIILSCGMSTLSEVDDALRAAGWYDGAEVALLLCTSQYPTPFTDVNASRLKTLKEAYSGLVLGYSDHTIGYEAAMIAYTFGARIFEKHFTLDKNFEGPDHWFSENTEGMRLWVNAIKNAQLIYGSPMIMPTATELINKKEFQRRIVALQDINEGEKFTRFNIGMRRVAGGNGFLPSHFFYLEGKRSWRKFKKNEVINYAE